MINASRRVSSAQASSRPGLDRMVAWSRERLVDYAPVVPRLPVVEDRVTQIESGSFAADAWVVSSDDVTLLRLQVAPRVAGTTIIHPDYVAVLLPVSWEDEFRIDGQDASMSALYVPREDGYFFRGKGRHLLAAGMRRDTLVKFVAALRGVYPEDVTLSDGALATSPRVAARLRARLGDLLAAGLADASRGGTPRLAEPVLDAVANAYIETDAGRPAKNESCLQDPTRIVRAAEDKFHEAGCGFVSLADLCSATGVCKSTLYRVFHDVYGAPPLRYFRQYRLVAVRSALLSARPERGAVKRAALRRGFREMGRFSVEYRRAFGESPSDTLARSLR